MHAEREATMGENFLMRKREKVDRKRERVERGVNLERSVLHLERRNMCCGGETKIEKHNQGGRGALERGKHCSEERLFLHT